MMVSKGSASDSWAEEEFGSVDLGDVRRTQRLITLARAFGQRPADSLPKAAQDPALLKAAYRLFDHDDEDFTPTDMLASHVTATYSRLATLPVVLAVSDTTYLDWSSHPATTGLGPLTTVNKQGLVLHSTIIITPERLPLGVIELHSWARDAATYGSNPSQYDRVTAEKESQKWLTSLAAVNLAHAAAPDTMLVLVADSEADFYELFVAERRVGVEVLVRAHHDRRVADPAGHLWAAMQAAPIAGTVTISLAAQSAEPARYGRPAVPAQPPRTAQVQLRYGPQTLKAPRAHRSVKHADVPVGVVWVEEMNPPAEVHPVSWMLLSSLPVSCASDAVHRLNWYTARWGIEVWHKALKSGCQIERRQLETAGRLQRCLALFAVIAWRIVYTTMFGRLVPDAPCTAILDTDEWEALYVRTQHTADVPPQAPPLGDAIRWLAQLGGFLGRTSDGAPGITVMWRGFQELAASVEIYRVMRAAARASPAHSSTSEHVGND